MQRIRDLARDGYKIVERYEECGLERLTDRARRLHRYANQLPVQVEAAIIAAKHEKPSWGARKIWERLPRRLPYEVKVPVPRQDRRGHQLWPPLPRSAKINLSTCLAGQAVGVKEVDDGIWLASFMDYDLGYVDLE